MKHIIFTLSISLLIPSTMRSMDEHILVRTCDNQEYSISLERSEQFLYLCNMNHIKEKYHVDGRYGGQCPLPVPVSSEVFELCNNGLNEHEVGSFKFFYDGL